MRLAILSGDLKPAAQQQDQLLIGLFLAAMPEQMACTFDGSLGGLNRLGSWKTAAGKSQQNLFDRSDAHGQMEPVEDVADRLAGCSTHQVRQRGLAVAHDRQRPPGLPPLLDESSTHGLERMVGTFRRQSKPPRLEPGHLDLSHRHVDMAALVAMGRTDVRAIDHHHHLVRHDRSSCRFSLNRL